AGPHCRVLKPGSGRVGEAGGCPTVGAGIVSTAGVQKAAAALSSAPDDHFTAAPDACVNESRARRIGGARERPAIRAGIVPSPRIDGETTVGTAPYDHLTARPYRRARDTAVRSDGRISPGIVAART